MGIPKGFERLLSNAAVGSREHEKHTKKHNVARDAASLSVVNFDSALRSYLFLLNVKKAAFVH